MEQYQLTKTIRFGLTKVRKEKKHLSHEELDELVMVSEERIKKEHPQAENQLDEQSFVKKIGDCSKAIKEYLLSWGKVCRRIDKITVRKEFFKILARKTFFKYESKVGKKRTPLPSEVKLSGQKGNNYYDEPINEGISQFWQNRVSKALKLHSQLESMLFDYKKAIETEKHNQENPKENNDQFDKLHLVDFRKMFLSVCSLVMDSLRPIVNELIIVSDNVSKDEDKYILDFVNDKSKQWDLFKQIEDLQNLCKDNGGNIPFGKATFNKYTSEQAPNHRDNDIHKVIRELKIEEFVSDFIGLEQEDIYRKIYQSTQHSLVNLNKPSISPIIRAQFFKYKPIPVLVRFGLANYLNKQQGKKYSNRLKDIQELFRIFGTSKSPELDYSDKNNRTEFSLDKYPIKVAFDYAWERCARSKYAQKPVDFPKEICVTFLETYFEYNSKEKNREAFEIYAHLLKVNECLATLEHFENEPPKDIKSLWQDVQNHLDKVGKLCSNEDRKAITQWYEEYKNLWAKGNYKKLKKWIESKSYTVTNFTQAKMHLGQKRGSQKTMVLKSYFHPTYGKIKDGNRFINSNVTEVFKNIASTFGKSFATIRDYFNEESEVNKIEYGAVIIKDKKGDKYLLLQKKNEGGIDMPVFNESDGNGDYDVYQVQSLTYKTVNKIYNSTKYPEFFAINGEKAIYAPNRPQRFKDDQEKNTFNEKKLQSLKKCLTESDFMTNTTENYLQKFNWTEEINNCTDFEPLAKIVDQKGYYLKSYKISKEQIAELVNNQNCYLLPIVNQNITAKTKNDTNQFTKDWNKIFNDEYKDYRLHPEFTMFYRYPTPDYPCPGEKRYSRFQMNVNFLMEVIPSEGEYVSRKEQIESFNTPKQDKEDNDNENSQAKKVAQFNDNINTKKPSYIIGIDRGINELATLCVINSEGKIVAVDENGLIKDEFDIYVKHFDKDNKCWIHNIKPKTATDNKPRTILDLSNLRVETTIDGKQVLVDLSSDENGIQVNSKQIVHLKRLYYLRCLSYLLQSSDYKSIILEKLKDVNNMTDDAIYEVFKNDKFIDSYKGGVQYTDLPYDEIRHLISTYQEIDQSNKTDSEKQSELNTLCQLDATESLKKGVVANMIGVVVYILKKLNYDAYISLENLCRALYFSKDSLSGYTIENTSVNPDLDFKDQENAKLAGLGTYSYFEIQLLKKLFKLQIDEKQFLVPGFRSVENYEKIVKLGKVKHSIYQFGVVHFVEPANTSLKCPICGANGKRIKYNPNYDEDELVCKKCGFRSNISKIQNSKIMEDSVIKTYYDNHNYKAIISGDTNAGFNIALRLLMNLNTQIENAINHLHKTGKNYHSVNK
ncbi:MAG: zinc ribbon domain-containing protein [Bacteroidales bacterium]|nr:zinc ribbon domain-containing protein [Bacteroidales bacterium]